MKILHLPVSYLPWTVGGKEVYCQTLCRALGEADVASEVAIHQSLGEEAEPLGRHEHEGIPVHVLPPLPDAASRRVAYMKTYTCLPGFDALLDEVRPDAVHFHDQSGSASLSHLRAVQAQGIPTVLTYHSPGQTCPQKELLRRGRIPCDGEVRLGRCTACRLNVSGVPRPLCDLVALAEWPGFDPWAKSPISRVLSGRTMTRLFQESLREFIERVDAVVVLAEWAREVWRLNGAPEEKLCLVRTGGKEPCRGRHARVYKAGDKLRVACLGRCTWVKGFHVLVDAVQGLPEDAPVEVHFLGPYWDSAYGEDLQRRVAGDRRFLPPRLVPNHELLPVLARMDVAAVPSLWLETGPLTVFDAFAAGIPVIGSRLGGIAEVVRDGKDGWLFAPGAAWELRAILAGMIAQPASFADVRRQVAPHRTMRDVATEMLILYKKVCASG